MHCQDVRQHLREYLLGELPPGVMRGLQLHLGGCGACRAALASARTTADVVVPFHLAALLHGEVGEDARRTLEAHLAYCEPCREERERLRAASDELVKNLSQYQLARAFRRRVMREWAPHRPGRAARHGRRGLADAINRAEAGNTFSYERIVDRYKDYAYLAAYLRVRDFLWAGEIARRIFTDGLPVFPSDLTHAAFLRWLDGQADERARDEHWAGGEGEAADGGLSGYRGSRKLRRHRLIAGLVDDLPEDARMPFLLFYVQRLGYGEIAALLETDPLAVQTALADATASAAETLAADERTPSRRPPPVTPPAGRPRPRA